MARGSAKYRRINMPDRNNGGQRGEGMKMAK